MQILYAAPFVALALIAFTICVLVPKGRKYAFLISGGVFAFALGALLGFLLMIFITDWVIHAKHPATSWFVVSFVVVGVTASLIAAFAIRLILSRLPEEILRWIVAFGSLGHLLILAAITLSGSLYPLHLSLSGRSLAILFVTLPLLVSLYPTIVLTRKSEQFRPNSVGLRM
jgi:MFS family permease